MISTVLTVKSQYARSILINSVKLPLGWVFLSVICITMLGLIEQCQSDHTRSMSQNRKKRPSGNQSRRKPLGKADLLPHPASYVREQSLRWHVALAAFQTGKGNGDLLAKLVKALYLAWFLQQAGFGALDRDFYLDAERILDAAARGANKDVWRIDPADCSPITRLLDLHEQQLLCAPVFAVDEAESSLVRFGRSDKKSPW
ncbi:hypothetical protein [Paraburkholderia sp. BCC1884]|uniref:hypothetical protein n=1 Tax=Paraburkholderia sp. BCC1884 TaxID=2562668 RepID=UPI00391F6281